MIAGVGAWNKTNNPNTNKPNEKVNFSSSNINLNSGFNEGSGPMTSAVAAATDTKNKIIFPVAGPATGSVLARIAANRADQLVIGVDVDQSYSYSQYDSYFFSSVLKKIGQATYDVLGDLYSDQTTTIGQFKLNEKSVSLFKGLSDNFVGFAKSSVGGRNSKEAQKAQAALDSAETFYKKNTIYYTNIRDRYTKTIQTTNDVAKYFKETIESRS